MTGYSGTPLLKKLGVKAGMTIASVGAPLSYKRLLGGFPEGVTERKDLSGEKLDFIHFFTKSQSELKKKFPRLKKSLNDHGMLWISWPKGSSKVETDLTETHVRKIGLDSGLVDVKVCAVDETWSGLKFVYRLKDRSSV